MKKFLTMLLALVMALSLVACGQTEQPDADKDAEGTSTDPFYIWTWNTDYQKILDEVLPKYLSEEQVSRIQIVNVGDSNIYQDIRTRSMRSWPIPATSSIPTSCCSRWAMCRSTSSPAS